MKGVIYARYSSDNQREESIEGQLRECKEYAERNGIMILGTYIDRALSAKTDNRPEFQHMIKDSAKGLFDVVLVWKLDRFARNRYDSARYKNILKKNGVKVISARENISEGSEGIILEAMLEGYAEYYSAELSEKVIRGLTDNALKCKYNGGTVPMGYYIDEQQYYQIDPKTAPVVLEMFTRYSEGATMQELVNLLNNRGMRSIRGGKITLNIMNHLLKNRRYMGEYSYRDVVKEDGIPAIVPKELFERVQECLAKNKKAPARHKAEDDYLLTTKLYCGKCGSFMVGESGTSHTMKVHRYYRCVNTKKKKLCDKKAVKKDWIEDLVVSYTMKAIMNDEVMERLIDTLMELQKRESTDLPLLKKQLAETEKGINNMLNAIQAGIFTPSTKQRLDELEETKSQLEISILQEEMHKPMLTREQIAFFIYRFRKFDVTKREQRQRLIDSFVNAVYLYEDKIILTFNYKDGSKTITLAEVEGSDLSVLGAWKERLIQAFFLCITTGSPQNVFSIVYKNRKSAKRTFYFFLLDFSTKSDYDPGTVNDVKKRSCSIMEVKPGRELEEFNSIYREFDRIYHEISLKLELSDSAFIILYAIVECGGGCLQKEIADFYFISKQTVHSAIKTLEARGFLSLEKGQGRDRKLYLTPAGQKLAEEKILPVMELENSVFAEMAPEESRALLDLTKKYVRLFREKVDRFQAPAQGLTSKQEHIQTE